MEWYGVENNELDAAVNNSRCATISKPIPISADRLFYT